MMANGNPVSKVEAISLARKYNMEYFETCSIGEAKIVQVFDHNKQSKRTVWFNENMCTLIYYVPVSN